MRMQGHRSVTGTAGSLIRPETSARSPAHAEGTRDVTEGRGCVYQPHVDGVNSRADGWAPR